MSKSFIGGILALIFASVANAQYYSPGYYNSGNSSYGAYTGSSNKYYSSGSFSNTNYYPPHKMIQRQQREIGQISVGADYVLGYASYKTVDFVLESALLDGKDFVSDTRDFDRSFNSISFNIGWRPLRYFGIEAFYSSSLGDDKVSYTESYSDYPEFARGEYSVSYKVYGLDLLGYIPINDYIEFIASIGVGKYDAEAEVKVTAYENNISFNPVRSKSQTFEDSVWAYRIGAGGQIWLSKHLAFRATVHWTKLGGDFMDYITEINAGVRYHF